MSLVAVAVPVPLLRLFTYRLPEGMCAPIGARVRVPFGPRQLVGVVMGTAAETDVAGTLRDVSSVLDEAPLLSDKQLALVRWLADYYLAPPGDAVALLLPPRMVEGAEAPRTQTSQTVRLAEPAGDVPKLGQKMSDVLAWVTAHGEASTDTVRAATGASLDTLRRLAERGLVTLETTQRHRDPMSGVAMAQLRSPVARDFALTGEQAAARDAIQAAFGSYRGFLLHGITGSGKTEVYLALIEAALARGEGAIVLVPEIALTPQLVSRFRMRLGERVAVQHSGLDPMARHEQWLRIRASELPVVVGARSALFAPIPRLGLIVVDEEHDGSFKQDVSPRYHGRDVALVRGHLEGCPVVLGSATPSVESWINCERGKLTRLVLASRTGAHLPSVELVDLRQTPTLDADHILSKPLVEALGATVAAGQQALLFLNRRGYATSIQCGACGEPLACDACSVSYTWHRHRARLVCHYCDEARTLPPVCPSCGRAELAEIGYGTERVEARLETLLPGARIARMDRDTTRGKALVKLLTRFRRREIDVLVGTQMLAKGHDFPGVTLVGVLLAEQGLAFPDFRAAERTFQLLTQIAGRAGRGADPGRVIVQTRLPEHDAIRFALTHDTAGFLAREADLRRARDFPPATHLALFRVAGPHAAEAERAAFELESALLAAAEGLFGAASDRATVMPAQPAPIERVKDRYRFQVLVRARDRRDLRAVLDGARPAWADRKPRDLLIGLDIDPAQFL